MEEKSYELFDGYIENTNNDQEKQLNSIDNYWLQYMNKHKVIFQFGSFIITKKRLVQFVCGFILARYISFAVTYLEII